MCVCFFGLFLFLVYSIISFMHPSSESVQSWCDGSSDRSFMVDPLSYFSFQPVLHDWCNKGCGMCYPVCGMVHIKDPLLLIGKNSPCGRSRFPLSQSEWSFTICPTPYNGKQNVLSTSLNKAFPSFLPSRGGQSGGGGFDPTIHHTISERSYQP